MIDLLRARGLCDALEPADHKAINASPLTPTQIVDAFGAAVRREWGGDWLFENLSVQYVIRRYQAFAAAQAAGPAGGRRRMRSESSEALTARLFAETGHGAA